MKAEAALLFLLLCPRPAAAQADLSGIDALLDKAARLKGCSTDCAAEAGARLKDPQAARWDGARVKYAAQAYQVCLAVARNDESPCEALVPLCKSGCRDDGPFHSSADLCKSFFGRVRLSKALISHDPAAMRLCLKKGPDMGERPLSAWQKKGLCEEVLTQGEKDQEGTCAKSVQKNYSVATPVTKSCDKGLRQYWGLAEPCVPEDFLAEQTHEAMTCLAADAAADFRKGVCGDDPLCRAMMGAGAKACAPYARKFVTAAGRALLTGARERLDALGPKELPGLHERVLRYESLKAGFSDRP